MYQPATTYQQLMQLQQPFVPVSCEYPAPPSSAAPSSATAASGSGGVSAPLPSHQPPPQPPQPPASPVSPPPPPALLESTQPDPAQVAKEVAQKNYVAALAFAAQQSAMAHAYTQQAMKARAAAGAAAGSLMRAPPYMMRPSWPPQPMPMPYYQQPYMYAMPPPTPPSAAAVAAAHAAHNPYKKMKTT